MRLLDGYMFAVYGTTGMVAVTTVAECFRHFTSLVGGRWKGEEYPVVMFINRSIHLWYEEGNVVKVCLMFVHTLVFITHLDQNRTMNAR